MKYTCATCGATMEAPGRYVIMSRGHYWHLPCTTLQSGEVGFPSSGKLSPVSILHTEPEPTPMQTHSAECWRDPAHHECAVAEIERLRKENEERITE